jgi:hypothetical protein
MMRKPKPIWQIGCANPFLSSKANLHPLWNRHSYFRSEVIQSFPSFWT